MVGSYGMKYKRISYRNKTDNAIVQDNILIGHNINNNALQLVFNT